MSSTNPPRTLIIILLMSMINEKQPFTLRCSILYLFQCFLFKNEEKKAEIIETLLPASHSHASNQSAATAAINAGQILCSGLFSQNDFVSNWICACALSHTINENNALKEQLLRVQLAINASSGGDSQPQAVSLMQQCMNILIKSGGGGGGGTEERASLKFQSKISFLMFLSTWLANCPLAVSQFLAYEQNIPYVRYVSYIISTMVLKRAKKCFFTKNF